ncbi:Exportin-6 [Chytridiales sp. JEL 0842]|nr:Exportin-6 [Chytridiales sp. JEL 0842]
MTAAAESVSLGSFSPPKGSLQWQAPLNHGPPSIDLKSSESLDMTDEHVVASTHCLNILLLLFSWIPLSDQFFIRPATDVMLQYCQLHSCKTVGVGTLAISCLNEIIARKYVPMEFVGFLLKVVQQICTLLQQLTSRADIELDDDYKVKLTDFLNNFLTNHVKRTEAIPGFPLDDFLVLLFKYTFQQSTPDTYQACLSIWDNFVEYVCCEKKDGADAAKLQRFESGLTMVAQQIHRKLSFSQPLEGAFSVSDEFANGADTEWERFSQASIDLIVKITELYPASMIPYLYTSFVGHYDYFGQSHHSFKLNDLFDLATGIRIFGQLSDLFTSNFESNAQSTLLLLEKFANLLHLLLANKTYQTSPSRITLSVLVSTRLYIHWISQFYRSPLNNENPSLAPRLLELAITSSFSDIEDVALEGSRLLCSITSSVRPYIINETFFQNLIESVHLRATSLLPEVKKTLYMAITNSFALPGVGARASDEEWAARSLEFGRFILPVILSYEGLVSMGNPQSLHTIEEMLASVLNFVLVLLTALRKQLSSEIFAVVMDAMMRLLSLLQPQELAVLIGTTSGVAIVDRLVLFMTAIVEDTSKATAKYLPGIISFSVSDFFHGVSNISDSNVDSTKGHFYDLLFKLITNHQRYFFGSQLRGALGRDTAETPHYDHLRAVVEIIALSFSDHNIDLVRQNLTDLDGLNTKCLLYRRDYFTSTLLIPFLTMLLGVLIRRSHETLREDILKEMTKMIEMDVSKVRAELPSAFINSYCGSMSQEQQMTLAGHFQMETASIQSSLELLLADYLFFLG